jgi:peptide/nickel transport system substrate-binding protein
MTPNSLRGTSSKVKVRSFTALLSLLVLFSMVLVACGGTTQSNQTPTKHILRVAAQSYDFAQSGFNPYNTHTNAGVQGLIYETLYFVNVNGGAFTPMLATDYKWNSDNTQVTFTIRQNVKWNDGQPFTADDVAFTFNLMKQYPAADSSSVWSFLSTVTAPDANTVVMTFQKAYPPVHRSETRLCHGRRSDQVPH